MEIAIPLDEEPYERILDVEGVIEEGSSAEMNFGGLASPAEPAHFEPTSIEWHEYDPLVEDPDADAGDPVDFYERHEDEVHEQAIENQADRYRDRWGGHPDV